jgi:tRNA pseudouridine55 synthase
MEVSKGTYVRSVIHDLGQELGCGAAMTNLVRTKQGPFTLDDCIQLEDAKNIMLLKEKLDQSKEYIKKMQ